MQFSLSIIHVINLNTKGDSNVEVAVYGSKDNQCHICELIVFPARCE